MCFLLSVISFFLKVYEACGKTCNAQLENPTSPAPIQEQLHCNPQVIQCLVWLLCVICLNYLDLTVAYHYYARVFISQLAILIKLVNDILEPNLLHQDWSIHCDWQIEKEVDLILGWVKKLEIWHRTHIVSHTAGEETVGKWAAGESIFQSISYHSGSCYIILSDYRLALIDSPV